MITICSYCRKTIEEKEPIGEKWISHGICQACFDYHVPRLLKRDLSRHLDRHIEPVIIVDSDCRILGINRPMASFLGSPKEQLVGLLTGELIGCSHAQLAEGCGKTIHCGTCTIRQTVNKSLATGADIHDVPAYLDRKDRRIRFLISAFNGKEFVKIVIEKMMESEPAEM
jgi:hypothetical protein